MMEKEKLRRADFFTSIIIIAFGLWAMAQAFGMPMQGTYAGVRNVWYVSPALMPLFVSGALMLLGTILMINSIRTGGAAAAIKAVRGMSLKLSEPTERFLSILLALITFVFLYIPRVDFFLSIAMFLIFFIVGFYFDDRAKLQKLTLIYLVGSAVFVVLFLTGIIALLNGVFAYAVDVLALIFVVILLIVSRRLAGGDPVLRRKFRISVIVSFATPVVLVPLFRYFLLVPLPREGGIVEFFNLVYYAIR